MDITPNSFTWAVAQLLSSSAQTRSTELLLSHASSSAAESEHEFLATIPDEATQDERSLLTFSQLLRSIGGFAEPEKCSGFTRDDQNALNASFSHTLERSLSGEYLSVAPKEGTFASLVNDYSSGAQWWTTPSIETFEGISFERGGLLSPRFSSNLEIIGSLPIAILLAEDSALEVFDRITQWRLCHTHRKVTVFSSHEIENTLAARILRIESAADFVELTEKHPLNAACKVPGNQDDWSQYGYDVLPNWSMIAHEYEGVVLSAGTYLADSWRTLSTAYGRTRISGWIPEAIYLFPSTP